MPEGSVARLVIPAVDVDAYVLEGTTPDVLNQGPGHYPETPLPGEFGNAAIAGHRTMYGHIFHDLHELDEGDTIQTHTTGRSTTFEVVEVKIVSPSELDVVADTDDTRLTLTTCHPIGSAAQRLVVVATARD
jgi:sortase A